MFAQVVINIPLDKVFTYRIPPHLVEKATLGTRVLVPFRSRRVIGYLVEVIAEVPNHLILPHPAAHDGDGKDIEIKEILEVLDDRPLIPPSILRLTRWIADYYLAPWGRVISGCLPAGVGFREKPIIAGKKKKMVRLMADEARVESFLQLQGLRAPKQAKILSALRSIKEMSRQELLKLTGASCGALDCLIRQGLVEICEQEVWPDSLMVENEAAPSAPAREIIPTQDQQRAIQTIKAALERNEFISYVLHGVTGSGKTYVYLQAVAHTLSLGKTALVMVPEISLTHQLISRFFALFGRTIAVLHCRRSRGERLDEWRRILSGEAKVVIGARSAIFAPLEKLGLIVLDEEHETSYKQDNLPRYHARDVALMRAKMANALLVLGSATPSLETFFNASQGRFGLISLPSRATTQASPRIRLIDMKAEIRASRGKSLIFSRPLIEAIEQRLSRGEQTILFINRRGFSNFLLCCECGHVPKCKNCSVSLTYHSCDRRLRCHYCNFALPAPSLCPACGGQLQGIGSGTQKVEEQIRRLFPTARVERMDQDTVSRKSSHQKILCRLGRGEIDILIGTQMIAKGLDFPHVTLVGVVAADSILNLPDFRSAERTFQLITQVSGRAGRGDIQGEVIVQTFSPSHYSLQCASRMDYLAFYQQEIQYRRELGYPPFSRMVNIIVRGGNINLLKAAATRLMNLLVSLKPDEITALGPAQAPIFKIRGQWRLQILLKSSHTLLLNDLIRAGLAEFQAGFTGEGIQIDIDVDPINLM